MAKKKTQLDNYTDFIYSITSEPAWIEHENEDGNTGVKLNKEGKGSAHRLDILNWAKIKPDGTIQYPSQDFYDTKFIKAINNTKHKAETIRYIEHHYNNTKDKAIFLGKIDSLFDGRRYQLDEKFSDEVRAILMEWYNHEAKVLSKQKPKKPNKFETIEKLKDVFLEGKYDDFVYLIEVSKISINGTIKKYGISSKAEGAYDYVCAKGWLRPYTLENEKTDFIKLFTLHYCGEKIADGAISQVNQNEVNKIKKILEGH